MRLIEKSLDIALQAYAGKVDKAWQEYILHPLRVMAKMRNELEMSAASQRTQRFRDPGRRAYNRNFENIYVDHRQEEKSTERQLRSAASNRGKRTT